MTIVLCLNKDKLIIYLTKLVILERITITHQKNFWNNCELIVCQRNLSSQNLFNTFWFLSKLFSFSC